MHPLIIVRLALSLALFIACAFACAIYCEAKRDTVLIGAAVAAVATFISAIYFANRAVERELWREPRPTQRSSDDVELELPSYEQTLVTAGFLKEPHACPPR